ncbi:hypothetical protein EDD93_2917 [Streptomyces sp. 840.1]|nr:hypothetical protein EDD93_2917 [Streptomyces sp. 840.1]
MGFSPPRPLRPTAPAVCETRYGEGPAGHVVRREERSLHRSRELPLGVSAPGWRGLSGAPPTGPRLRVEATGPRMPGCCPLPGGTPQVRQRRNVRAWGREPGERRGWRHGSDIGAGAGRLRALPRETARTRPRRRGPDAVRWRPTGGRAVSGACSRRGGLRPHGLDVGPVRRECVHGVALQTAVRRQALGAALGLFRLPLIVGVQSTAGWAERGTTTASVLFCRQLGQSIGAALFGAVANGVLAARLAAAPVPGLPGGLDSVSHAPDDPGAMGAAATDCLRRAVDAAVDRVCPGAAAAAVVAPLVLVFVAPRRFPVLTEEPDGAPR